MMPVAWTKTYQVPEGEPGRVFMTTMGAASDLVSAPLRRLVVNGVYWSLRLDDAIPAGGTNAELVGDYSPSQFSFNGAPFWVEKGLKIDDLR